jgi:GTPase
MATIDVDHIDDLDVSFNPDSLYGPDDKLDIIYEENIDDLPLIIQQQMDTNFGETIYEIGDNSDKIGLSELEYTNQLNHLSVIADKLNANMTILNEVILDSNKNLKACAVLIRYKSSPDIIPPEIHISVIGNVDSGKSSLTGWFKCGKLDDGRGFLRNMVSKHLHEIQSGKTSDDTTETIGIDSCGKIVNHTSDRIIPDNIICEKSSKIYIFTDLAGHEKYYKTTVKGLTGSNPHYAMLTIGANMGVVGMTKEHIGATLALKIPLFVVITKIDIAPDHILNQTMLSLTKLLKSTGSLKIPIIIRDTSDVMIAIKSFYSPRYCPIFLVSNVRGDNLNLLSMFINLLVPNVDMSKFINDPIECSINGIYSNVPGVGLVVAGNVTAGTIKDNDTLLLGPNSLGDYYPVTIRSIEVHRKRVKNVCAGHTAAFALRKIKRNEIMSGMMLLDPILSPLASLEFIADVMILYHSSTISINYQAVVHCGTVRQSVKIVDIFINNEIKDVLRTGNKARITFRFMRKPEYIKIGSRLLFREGKTKGVGKIHSLIPLDDSKERIRIEKKNKRKAFE